MKILKIKYLALYAISFILLFGAIPSNADKSAADIYLAQKKSLSAEMIAPTVLKNNIISYINKTVELCGKVKGKVSSEASISFMIDCGDDVALISSETALPECITDGNDVRVLVSVPENMSIGNYKLVMAAYKYEIEDREKELAPKPKAVSTKTTAPNRGSTDQSFKSARQSAGSNISSRAMQIYDPYKKAISQMNPRLTEQQLDVITKSVLASSERYGVDPRLVVAIILAESNFKPNAKSRAGAMGLGQLMPGTAKGLGVNNAYNPSQNIDGCVKLIAGHMKNYKGNHELSLAAYNAGAGAVKKYGGIPPYKETQNYVRKVKAYYKQLCGN